MSLWTPGTGAGLLPVPAPNASRWRGSIVMNRQVSEAPEVEGVIAFRANVTNLEITKERKITNATPDVGSSQVDAALPALGQHSARKGQ